MNAVYIILTTEASTLLVLKLEGTPRGNSLEGTLLVRAF